MKELDVFISGETMDLCIPTLDFSKNSDWYTWFNKPSITQYLDQGLFPNTADEQEEFFLSQKKQERLILIISNKSKYIGVVSLSHIDLVKKTCDIAIVVDASLDIQNSPFIALEAIARITEHAFDILGINRIFAGQHIGLIGWRQRMELLGYKVEGIHTDKFIKGREISNAVTLATTYKDYQKILERRSALWDSKKQFLKRFKALPKYDFTMRLENFFEKERTDYYDKLFRL